MKGLDAFDATGKEFRNRVELKTGGLSAGATLRLRF
jgi:hypothetical protein